MTTGEEAFPYPDTSPEDVDAARLVVHRIYSLLTDTRADVDDGNLTLTSSWGGYAAESCVADIAAMTTLLASDSGLAQGGVSTLTTYASRIADVRDDIDSYRKKYDAALATQQAANAKIPHGLPDEDKEPVLKGHADDFNAAVAPLYIAYNYTMQAHGGNAALAAQALNQATDVLSPPSYRQSPTGGKPDIDAGSYTSAGVSLSLVMTLDASPDADRRKNQLDAYLKQFGVVPTGPNQWKVAAILDPTTYQAKNAGVDSVIQVGKVTPQPGKGLVRIGFYIPADVVANLPPDGDLGDNRNMDPNFDPEQTRVCLYIDYETGTIIARQNPTVSTNGDVAVGTPTIKVQQNANGQIRIFYDAANPLAGTLGKVTGHTVNGDIVVTPPYAGSPTSAATPAQVSGTTGDYPSTEIYTDNGLGQTSVVLQDEASDLPGDVFDPGDPAWFLTQHHEVGPEGAAAVDPFYSQPDRPHTNPYLKYPDRYPDTTLGDPDNPPVVVTVPP